MSKSNLVPIQGNEGVLVIKEADNWSFCAQLECIEHIGHYQEEHPAPTRDNPHAVIEGSIDPGQLLFEVSRGTIPWRMCQFKLQMTNGNVYEFEGAMKTMGCLQISGPIINVT